MTVIDASVVVRALLRDGPDADTALDAIRQAPFMAAPAHLDTEVLAALRKLWLRGVVTEKALLEAPWELSRLDVERMPISGLADRALELRDNLTVYDALYAALAEALDVPLITADRRLADAPGIRCRVRVLR